MQLIGNAGGCWRCLSLRAALRAPKNFAFALGADKV